MFPKADDLRKVRIAGSHDEYLCELDLEGSCLRLALLCKGDADEEDLKRYLLLVNIGKVEDVQFNVQTPYTSKCLTKAEKILYTFNLNSMNEAVIYAIHYWENEVFTKIISGSYSFER